MFPYIPCCFITVILFLTSLVPCSATGTTVEKEKLPLYEYGVVGLAAQLPHYRGSDEYSSYAFPLPYFIYRGEKIKANRDGLRGIFWRNAHFQTDISISGNPPVTDDNDAREGMGELDGLVEIGPALRFYFYDYGERESFFLQWNIRAGFSFGFDGGLDVSYQGLISDFSLVYRNASLFRDQNVRIHMKTGPQFSDSELHSYFYEVSEQYVTDRREQYTAEAGYGGWQVSGGIVKELTPKFWLSFYGRYINSSGAAFEDSPLVETTDNYVVGTMLLWKFGESETLEQ
ncbi:MipA/OmpV family protein [Desulforhopalus sp. 52FAK]